jgi:hypothetical protein
MVILVKVCMPCSFSVINNVLLRCLNDTADHFAQSVPTAMIASNLGKKGAKSPRM